MVQYDFSFVGQVLPQLLGYVPLTLAVCGVTALLGSLLGGFLAYGEMAGGPVLARLARGYIFVIRCTPPIVLLFLVFYGLPQLLRWGLGIATDGWSRGTFTVIALTLLFAAPVAEVFKTAYRAVPPGQKEAALTVGLTPLQAFYRILLPQACRIGAPNFANSLLNLLKDAALAYTIGLLDLMGGANLLISRNLGNHSLETYTATALIYWGLALVLAIVLQLYEKSWPSASSKNRKLLAKSAPFKANNKNQEKQVKT